MRRPTRPLHAPLTRSLFLLAATSLELAAAPTLGIEGTVDKDGLVVRVSGIPSGLGKPAVFLAIDDSPTSGTRIVPYGRDVEGSTLFLPIAAERLLRATPEGQTVREHGPWSWSEAASVPAGASSWQGGLVEFRLPGKPASVRAPRIVAWVKDLAANDGWGRLVASSDPTFEPGEGDRGLQLATELARDGARPVPAPPRVVIYQLLPRLFSNTNETRAPNGTLAQNGSGRFADIDERALAGLRELGTTHLWLTGVLRQATSTDYSAIGLPADDADLLKGLAGSPYAVRDYFDVCPDYAVDPAKRLEEFQALLARAHAAGLRVLIDLVPNHVARSYASVVKPEHDFGRRGRGGVGDDPEAFFHQGNNFFHVQVGDRMRGEEPPLKLPSYNLLRRTPLSPTAVVLADKVDGLFAPETRDVRVTGNNLASFSPPLDSWYETVKLNYGFDYTRGTHAHPGPQAPNAAVPDTWTKMDAVIAHWQSLGVDGFRCDMAHMVPIEFWRWAVSRARVRDASVFFCAEAYDDDPARVPPLDALEATFQSTRLALLAAGFDAVYDDPSYDRIKDTFDAGGSLEALRTTTAQPLLQSGALRYAENHDEVRLASARNWGGAGLEAGPAVTALLWALGPGPVLLYSGQEVGEPAAGVEGFGGDDGRTSIFDYWSMPELAKWVNGSAYDGGRLSETQRALRSAYAALGALANEPALRGGTLTFLNPRAGAHLPDAGRRFTAALRHDPISGQRLLIVSNLHPKETLSDLALGLAGAMPGSARIRFSGTQVGLPDPVVEDGGLRLPRVPPLTTLYVELR